MAPSVNEHRHEYFTLFHLCARVLLLDINELASVRYDAMIMLSVCPICSLVLRESVNNYIIIIQ